MRCWHLGRVFCHQRSDLWPPTPYVAGTAVAPLVITTADAMVSRLELSLALIPSRIEDSTEGQWPFSQRKDIDPSFGAQDSSCR